MLTPDDQPQKAIARAGRGEILANFLLVVVTLAIFLLVTIEFYSQYPRMDEENLRAFIAGYGVWAPVMYALVYLASAPLPFFAAAISAVGGLLFGTLRGAIFTILVSTLAALIPFLLARRLGAGWVAERMKGRKVETFYHQSGGKNGFLFVMMLRLLPIVPWEVQSYLSGLTRVSTTNFLLATLLGGIPSSFAFSFLGDAFTKTNSWQFSAAIALVLLLSIVIPYLVTRLRLNRDK